MKGFKEAYKSIFYYYNEHGPRWKFVHEIEKEIYQEGNRILNYTWKMLWSLQCVYYSMLYKN